MKILLIDDEPDILLHMKKALQMLGHSCDSFEDPLAALNHFGEGRYDLVISDVQMQEMNGFAVAAEIRRIAPAAKIILVSGHFTADMGVTASDISEVSFMRKPIDVHMLKRILDKVDPQLPTASGQGPALEERSLQKAGLTSRQ